MNIDETKGRTAGDYERFRPRVYRPRMSIFWWVKRKAYVLFIMRELTSVFVAIYVLFILYQVHTLGQGAEAWEALLAWMATPVSITFHMILLIGLLYHSFTWIWIAPTATVLRIRGKRVPDRVIIAANLILWLLLSLVVAWFVVNA